MEIITLYAGQGNCAVIVGEREAIVVDTHLPGRDDPHAEIMKAAIAKAVKGKKLIGLVLTGFDQDHCDPRGVAWLLRRYHPGWVLYPTYRKRTECADKVFDIIEDVDERRGLDRISIRLDRLATRQSTDLSSEWDFEFFSPHVDDMNSSNNSSLVAKVKPKTGRRGFSYLITGDTELDRWQSITTIFGSALKTDVLAAPHHGSNSAIDLQTLWTILPDTVLISAGAGNQFGHPHWRALALYHVLASNVHSTHYGTSLRTTKSSWGLSTTAWSAAS